MPIESASSKIEDWLRTTLTILITSGILIGYGQLSSGHDIDTKRLDRIDAELSTLNERVITAIETGVKINAQQAEQIRALERRLELLEQRPR